MIAHLRGRLLVKVPLLVGWGLIVCLPSPLCAQQMSPADRVAFARQVRTLYYALSDKGFNSLTCDVMLNWDTVPSSIMLPMNLVGKEQLESTRFRFTLDSRESVSFLHEYPKDTGAVRPAVYDKFIEWFSSVVKGFFMTWGAKAIGGPIPDAYMVSSLEITSPGHRIRVNVPERQIEVLLSQKDIVTQILTHAPGQELDEHPAFTPSADGLLLSAVDATNKTGADVTHIKYDLEYQLVNGLQVPHNIHLMVNDNMDMRFSMENCSVERRVVVQVGPPASK